MHKAPAPLPPSAAARWTMIVDCLKQATDSARRSIDSGLGLIFFSQPIGRWTYDHTLPNDWTALRMFASWIPMVLIIYQQPLWAIGASCLIWSTDIIDGWMARKKGLVSEAGMKFETSVDTAFNLQTFIGVSIVYPDARRLLMLAGVLELVRLAGAIMLRRHAYDGEPNRSGKVKTWGYVIGTNLRLIAPPVASQIVLLIGIGLSAYSMVMHIVRFATDPASRGNQPRH